MTAAAAYREGIAARATAPAFAVSVDNRDPVHTAWTFADDVEIRRTTLRTGDYAPAGYEQHFTIERKALPDLVACCTTARPRFVRCLERMSKLDFAVIIVEASLDDVARGRFRSQAHPSSIIGSVSAFHVDFGVPTIWAGNPAAAANIAERLMRRYVAQRVRGVAT